MILIGDTAHLSLEDLTRCGIKADTVVKACSRGSLTFIKDPQDARKSLFPWPALPTSYQDKVVLEFGDPYTYLNSEGLRQRVRTSVEASDYFRTFRFPDGTGLPIKHQGDYTTAASWLVFLASTKPKAIGYAKAPEFWNAVCRILKEDGVALPTNYGRLKAKVAEFQEKGFQCLISAKFGNDNTVKLGAVQKAYLREVYANPDGPQILLPSQVCFMYASQAAKSGWPQVSDKAILNYLAEPEVQVLCGRDRYGKKALLDIIPVINRVRPTYPHDMWGIDGSPFELGFREGNKSGRLYVFMVVDYMSSAVVGYAISESETGEVVMEAVKAACVNNQVLPHQIQSDHSSAIMRCKAELEQIAEFTPARVGWARSKAVEAVQAHINTQVLKWFPNYTGANITARKADSHINRDETAKHLPTRAVVIEQIHLAIQLWNTRANTKGVTPSQLLATSSPRVRTLGIEDQIRLFGVPRRKPVTYSNEGITIEVNGQDIRYIVPDADFYVQNYGRQFMVKLDPTDTTMVGLFDPTDGRLVEFAYLKTLIPMATVDMTPEKKKSLFKQAAIQKGVEHRMDMDAQTRKELLDAELVAKVPLGVEGRFKDQLNGAIQDMKAFAYVTRGQEPQPSHNSPAPGGIYWEDDLIEGRDLDT